MIFLFLACTGTKDTATYPNEGSLNLLTYNVHGLPPEITGDDTTARTERIAPLLSDFDIIGLQEDFIDDNHDILATTVPHPYQDRFNDKVEESRYYGSGLSVFSYSLILGSHNTHYTACNGYLDGSSDCLASKGFQVVEIELSNGQSIHLYNTHLEAGGGTEDNQARQVHVDQLVESLQNHSANKAVVFLGDTNLHANDSADIPMLEQLLEQGDLLDSCEAVGCPESDHIDRIFYRSSTDIELTVENWSRDEGFVDEEGNDLSDHPAITVTISWNSQ